MAPCESPATRTLRLQYMCVQTVLGSGLTVCLGFGLGPCLWAGPGPSTRRACFFLNRGSASRVHMGFKEGHTETPRKRDRARGAEPPPPAGSKSPFENQVKRRSQNTKSKYQVEIPSKRDLVTRPSRKGQVKIPSQKAQVKRPGPKIKSKYQANKTKSDYQVKNQVQRPSQKTTSKYQV